MSDISREEILQQLKDRIKKHPSIDAHFRKSFIGVIGKHINEMLVINKIFKIDTKFLLWFVKDLKLNKNIDTKKEKQYYRNFLRLKKFALVHKRSTVFFPKSLILCSINPNHSSLIDGDISRLDNYAKAREYIIKALAQEKNIREMIYVYLRFFHIYLLSASILSGIKKSDIIILPNRRVVLCLWEKFSFDVSEGRGMYRLILLDAMISKYIYQISFTMGHHDLLFIEDSYEKYMRAFMLRYMEGFSISMIKQLNRNFYLFRSTPIQVTVESKMESTVQLTLSELVALFPNEPFLSVEKVEMEKRLISQVFDKNRTPQISEKKVDNSQKPIYGLDDMEMLMKLIKKKGTQYTQREVTDATLEIERYLTEVDNIHEELIYSYVLHLLAFLRQRRLALSSVRNYLLLLNKHLFKMVINLANLQTEELSSISSRLELMQYKHNSVKAIYKIIKRFFKFHRAKYPELMDITILSYPKSMIFRSEIDLILDKIEKNYIEQYSIKKKAKKARLQILQRKVLVLFGFYFGLRRNEARTREYQDFYHYGETYYIDVNNSGMRKAKISLKSTQSKRRVSAVIDTPMHLEIIYEWEVLRGEVSRGASFLFLRAGSSGVVTKKVIEESVFEEINSAIKEVTGRYCSFHSLRHSFATYHYEAIVKKGKKTPYGMMELAIMMGHQTPQTTLSAYIHADLLGLDTERGIV